jgi:hypothetical protein
MLAIDQMRSFSLTIIDRYKLDIGILLLYLALTVVFTFPLFLHLSTFTPLGDGSGDQFQSIWNLWWFKTALIELQTNFLYTNYIYYPQGTNLVYQPSIFLGAVWLPIVFFLDTPQGLVFSHNLILILTFVLTGFGMYLLIKHLTAHPLAAFLGGLLFTFCSYRLWHMNHLNLLSTQWIPLYVLCLLKSLKGKPLGNLLGAGLFFILTFLSSLTYALFLGLFTLLYSLYLLIRSPKQLFDKRFIRSALIALICVVAVLAPVLYSLWSTQVDWEPSPEEIVRASANPVGYFLPTKETSLLGGFFLPSYLDYRGIPGNETFLGWVLIFFVFYTWIKTPRHKAKFWFFSGLFFFVLSLGPALQVFGRSYHFSWLPYTILYNCLPILKLGRTPCRFSIMVTLCLIVFSGYGLARIFHYPPVRSARASELATFLRSFLTRRGMPLLVAVLIILEFIVFPTIMIKINIPECYHQMKNAEQNCALLELPTAGKGYSLMFNVRMYYQTCHSKKVVNGYLPRPSRGSRDFLENVLSNDYTAVPGEVRLSIDTTALARNNVKYVIVHEAEQPSQAICRRLGTSIFDLGCIVIEEKSSGIKIYRLF